MVWATRRYGHASEGHLVVMLDYLRCRSATAARSLEMSRWMWRRGGGRGPWIRLGPSVRSREVRVSPRKLVDPTTAVCRPGQRSTAMAQPVFAYLVEILLVLLAHAPLGPYDLGIPPISPLPKDSPLPHLLEVSSGRKHPSLLGCGADRPISVSPSVILRSDTTSAMP